MSKQKCVQITEHPTGRVVGEYSTPAIAEKAFINGLPGIKTGNTYMISTVHKVLKIEGIQVLAADVTTDILSLDRQKLEELQDGYDIEYGDINIEARQLAPKKDDHELHEDADDVDTNHVEKIEVSDIKQTLAKLESADSFTLDDKEAKIEKVESKDKENLYEEETVIPNLSEIKKAVQKPIEETLKKTKEDTKTEQKEEAVVQKQEEVIVPPAEQPPAQEQADDTAVADKELIAEDLSPIVGINKQQASNW
jgi:hypothetical protein